MILIFKKISCCGECWQVECFEVYVRNKDENAHSFALSALREKERKKKRGRERDSFGILYKGYLLSTVKVKKERDRKRETEKERKRET